jgi:hypothetical protein
MNDKFRISKILFLSFLVLSSKHILIYNEETLVALSFFCFLFFVYRYFGTTLRDSFNERSQSIQSQLQNSLISKESSFNELLKEHQKGSGLVKAIKKIDLFTNHECTRLHVHGKKALRNLFIIQIQQKLKNLAFSSSLLQQKLQHLHSDSIFSYVLLSFQKAKQQKTPSGNNKKPIKNALQLLAITARTS